MITLESGLSAEEIMRPLLESGDESARSRTVEKVRWWVIECRAGERDRWTKCAGADDSLIEAKTTISEAVARFGGKCPYEFRIVRIDATTVTTITVHRKLSSPSLAITTK